MVHPVHLAQTFRKFYRCTIGDYVRSLRIEFACRQLAATKMPLSEIALLAGFADQSHFTRTFRKRHWASHHRDADVFGYHFEEDSLAINLFHVRAGKIVDRREFFWENLQEFLEASVVSEEGTNNSVGVPRLEPEIWQTADSNSEPPGAPSMTKSWEGEQNPVFNAGQVFSALLKQLYIDQHYVPRTILVPVDFDDREALATLLSERVNHRVEIAVPQRGEKKSLIDLAGQNARQSYIQRFRVLEPSRKAIQESLVIP